MLIWRAWERRGHPHDWRDVDAQRTAAIGGITSDAAAASVSACHGFPDRRPHRSDGGHRSPPVPGGFTAGHTMNATATGLMTISAAVVVGFGILIIAEWVARARADQFGAGEMFGIAVGIVILSLGAGLGWGARAVWRNGRGGWIFAALWATALIVLAYIALSTPGPPPLPVPLSVAAVIVGLAIASLVIARAARRLGS